MFLPLSCSQPALIPVAPAPDDLVDEADAVATGFDLEPLAVGATAGLAGAATAAVAMGGRAEDEGDYASGYLN